MSDTLSCPKCGREGIEVASFESMIVVSEDSALFTLACPGCGASISTVQAIPPALMGEVRAAAEEAGAGMGER